MNGKSYSSKITSVGCALCTNCLDVIYCSVHLSFIVLSTCPKSAVSSSSRGLDLSPNNKRIGAWTLSDWRHIGQPIISHLNTYILYLQLWSNDLNSQHITNHQLGFKLFTVHSSPAQRPLCIDQFSTNILKLIIDDINSEHLANLQTI